MVEFHLVKFAESQPLLYQSAIILQPPTAGTTLQISILRALKIHPHGSFTRTSHTRRNSRPAGPFSPIHSCIVVSYRRSKCLESRQYLHWDLRLDDKYAALYYNIQVVSSTVYICLLSANAVRISTTCSLASQSYPRLA